MSDAHVIHETAGTITVSPPVLAQVVRGAVEQADAARVRRGRRALTIEVHDGRARVALELAVRFGAVLPEVGEQVQRRVAEALRDVCGLEPAAVDVAIEEVDG
jgi:uncharacterized alkaline shock family protein YloU